MRVLAIACFAPAPFALASFAPAPPFAYVRLYIAIRAEYLY